MSDDQPSNNHPSNKHPSEIQPALSSRPATETFVIAPGNVNPEYLEDRSLDLSTDEWQQSRSAILLVLFIVTGCFGIKLLWRSNQFTNVEKVIWSVLVTVYTLGLFALLVWVIRSSVASAFQQAPT